MRPWAVGVDARHLEAGVAGDGELDHPHTLVHRRQAAIAFVRRIARRHEIDDREIKLIARLFGEDQMADVDGIEGAAEHADAQCGRRCVCL